MSLNIRNRNSLNSALKKEDAVTVSKHPKAKEESTVRPHGN